MAISEGRAKFVFPIVRNITVSVGGGKYHLGGENIGKLFFVDNY